MCTWLTSAVCLSALPCDELATPPGCGSAFVHGQLGLVLTSSSPECWMDGWMDGWRKGKLIKLQYRFMLGICYCLSINEVKVYLFQLIYLISINVRPQERDGSWIELISQPWLGSEVQALTKKLEYPELVVVFLQKNLRGQFDLEMKKMQINTLFYSLLAQQLCILKKILFTSLN